MDIKKLQDVAVNASKTAYVPYSDFQVGAALLTIDGKIFEGCNIENASFGLTNCAERTAIFKAISDGEEKGDFVALAVYGEKAVKPISPCGACRQVMAEFFDKDLPVYLISKHLEVKKTTVEELLPYQFDELN
ncbi:cytidine deaminase [Floricoccus tropicus]|uniref:Cytidine deaminase n=1 Tax=Floricoccus tropicus TaxID=1859473 RepID=A0A1E8GPY3_9LACT|nr:cytidine deaminase [Floricoccus tropicus]OFI50277.1 cytidine deaminase [Floricoccus tropicus]